VDDLHEFCQKCTIKTLSCTESLLKFFSENILCDSLSSVCVWEKKLYLQEGKTFFENITIFTKAMYMYLLNGILLHYNLFSLLNNTKLVWIVELIFKNNIINYTFCVKPIFRKWFLTDEEIDQVIKTINCRPKFFGVKNLEWHISTISSCRLSASPTKSKSNLNQFNHSNWPKYNLAIITYIKFCITN
jgi:hypothetical protein